jgi:hypothetical protein
MIRELVVVYQEVTAVQVGLAAMVERLEFNSGWCKYALARSWCGNLAIWNHPGLKKGYNYFGCSGSLPQ